MRLEDYLDIQGPMQIRVKGHRIGIEIMLGGYLDEGLSAEEIAWRCRAIRKLLQARDENTPCWVVGENGAPATGTPDPELLEWIEESNCMLVTRNHASMPKHLQDHMASGRHVPGIIVMKRRVAPWQMVEEQLLIWGASLPGEYQDQIVVWPQLQASVKVRDCHEQGTNA